MGAIRAADSVCEGRDMPIEEMPLPKQAREDMADNVANVIAVEVRDASDRFHCVSCLSAPCPRSRLWLELTQANVELLCMGPKATDADDFAPAIRQPCVPFQ
eukprot:3744264-Pyramimonas_sp.AAC.1